MPFNSGEKESLFPLTRLLEIPAHSLEIKALVLKVKTMGVNKDDIPTIKRPLTLDYNE